jgi:putative transposase
VEKRVCPHFLASAQPMAGIEQKRNNLAGEVMPRTARIVIPGTPHHVVQRGNRRQRTFFSPADYRTYLRIAAEEFAAAGVSVWTYCLMPNHVHLIAAPSSEDGLARAVGRTHLRYTRLINEREGWRGFLWQGRFASFPMDEGHLLACARYVGLNPVRARLVASATQWPWSSVRAHVAGRSDGLVSLEPLADRLEAGIGEFFDDDVPEATLSGIRQACVTGVPLGPEAWLKSIAANTGRSLAPRRRGRPPKNGDTHAFPFESEGGADRRPGKACVSPFFAQLG